MKVAGVSGAHAGDGPIEIIMTMHLLWGEMMYQRLVVSETGSSARLRRVLARSGDLELGALEDQKVDG